MLILSACGSSPRVRGTVIDEAHHLSTSRFIPACAGNSPISPSQPTHQPVHPRVCGEQNRSQGTTPRQAGSSPRVRGTEFSGPGTILKFRFIPACAGNSLKKNDIWGLHTVHPRVCGEQICTTPPQIRKAGSSPRVRGTDVTSCINLLALRFIPACAGNSLHISVPPNNLPVHPRVCGEQFLLY